MKSIKYLILGTLVALTSLFWIEISINILMIHAIIGFIIMGYACIINLNN